MRAKQRDVRRNGTQRLYESPPECWALFYEIRTLVRERMRGLQTWRRPTQRISLLDSVYSKLLHKPPRWCISFYRTELGNWNVFGPLRKLRLKLLSLEKQKTSRLSSLNAPFSIIILHREPSEYCLPYWQCVSMRKTWKCVQGRGGEIYRRRTDWLAICSLNRIYTVTWK